MKKKELSNIIIYKSKGSKTAIEVNLNKESIWLTQEQISQLFEKDRSVITKHLGNIFKSGELQEKAMCKKCTLQNQIKR